MTKTEIQDYATSVGLPCFDIVDERGNVMEAALGLAGFDDEQELEMHLFELLEQGAEPQWQIFRMLEDDGKAEMVNDEPGGERMPTDGLGFYIGNNSYLTGLLISVE